MELCNENQKYICQVDPYSRLLVDAGIGTTWIVFTTVSFTYIIISWVLQHYVITDTFYIHNFSGKLSIDRIQTILHFRHKWAWIGYAFVPVSLFIKVGYAATAINIGLVLFNIDLGFRSIFRAALVGQTVFITASLVKLSGYLWWHPVHSVMALIMFYPLTLASVMDLNKVPHWFWYPLETINVYETIYCFVVAGYLAHLFKKNFKELLGDVIISYGSALVLWMGVIVFLSLQIM